MSNTNKLKQITTEAKKIRLAKPNLKWTDAIKLASKKINGNGTGADKLHKDTNSHNVNIKVVSGKNDLAKQIKVNQTINKKYANYEYPVPPVHTGNWTVKDWENWILKYGTKMAGVKKKTAKKKVHTHWAVIPKHKRRVSGYDSLIDFTRVNNDINGNGRYVVHFLNFLNDEEKAFLPLSKKYEYALKKAKLIGGKKYNNKSYGGGIVFTTSSPDYLEQKILELKNKTPKIKI